MKRPTTAAGGAAFAVLLLAGCATGPDQSPEADTAHNTAPADTDPSSAPADDEPRTKDSYAPGVRGTEAADASSPLICGDGEAAAANEGHEPAGWPAGVGAGDPLPDPECHPDFISQVDWEPYYGDCWHPKAHGTVPTDAELERAGQEPLSVQERRAAHWEASEIRSWWIPPAEGESCFGHDGGVGVEFTVDHAPDGRHGLEVAVSFNVHRQAVNNEANVIRAVARAVDAYPDYDLIIVRGYSDAEMTDDTTQLIDAWYKPENVENVDLDSPEGQSAYEHCYSCSVNGQHR